MKNWASLGRRGRQEPGFIFVYKYAFNKIKKVLLGLANFFFCWETWEENEIFFLSSRLGLVSQA